MGFVTVLIGAVFIFGGAVICGFVGFVAGLLIRRKQRDGSAASRLGGGFHYGSLGFLIGLALGCGGLGVSLSVDYLRDAPAHGYADRAAYRDAEIDARTRRLEPLIQALERYRADYGRYPERTEVLLDEEYLMEPLQVGGREDHLDEPNRIWASYSYAATPSGDQFTIDLSCAFDEEPSFWNLMYHRETRYFRSGGGGWQKGTAPTLPAIQAPAPPAAKGTRP